MASTWQEVGWGDKLSLGFLRSSHKGLVSAKVSISAEGF